MAFSTQLLPPSCETYTGAFPMFENGLGVNAEATMTWGLAVWMARKGSLSWFVSPLRLAGIRSTTLIEGMAGGCPRANRSPAAIRSTAKAGNRTQKPARAFIVVDSPVVV